MKARLLHPVEIRVRNIDVSSSTFDADFEEATDLRYEESFVVMGQVRVYKHRQESAGGNGFELLGDGYILVKKADAEDIRLNAEIVTVAGNPAGYKVIEKRPSVHYGTNEMMMCFYKHAGKSVENR